MAKKKSKTKKLPNMSLFGTNGSRGSKNPYAGIKPYPTKGPQGQPIGRGGNGEGNNEQLEKLADEILSDTEEV